MTARWWTREEHDTECGNGGCPGFKFHQATHVTAPGPKPVGELLAGEIDVRGWSQGDFAEILDRPVQFVSEVVSGKRGITRESAAQIGAALGQTAEYWLNLQHRYLLSEQAKNVHIMAKLDGIRRRALLRQKAPDAGADGEAADSTAGVTP